MSIIDKVLKDKIFEENPPVLIDIGASGEIDKKWKTVAKYSVCVAFDADERELGYITKESSGYRRLIIYNSIVKASDENEADFYLTKSPFCSSLLEPDSQALKYYSFSDKFKVESVVQLQSRSLNSVLKEQNLKYVDWFKTDSQGTDLRLFQNIPEEIRNNILVAEFEPGLIDSYKKEDKLFSVLSYLDSMPFWLSELKIKGNQRISQQNLDLLSRNTLIRKLLSYSIKESPGWGEMLYVNTFNQINKRRDLLLGWVFAVVNRQYGFALELLNKADSFNNEELFIQMKQYTIRQIKMNVLKLKFLPAVLKNYLKL
jgi:hypothetical protein